MHIAWVIRQTQLPAFGHRNNRALLWLFTWPWVDGGHVFHASVFHMCPETCWSFSPPMTWRLAGFDAFFRAMHLVGREEGEWAHVVVGGCKTSWGEAGGTANRDGPFSDNTVSLQNVFKLILSHFPLAPSIYPGFNPSSLALLSLHFSNPFSFHFLPKNHCSILPTSGIYAIFSWASLDFLFLTNTSIHIYTLFLT